MVYFLLIKIEVFSRRYCLDTLLSVFFITI
nr:MAG TPA: hypothetical protein [Crassvirales sp.]